MKALPLRRANIGGRTCPPPSSSRFSPTTAATLRASSRGAELHFTGGDLDGLKLIGFSIWERRGGTGRNVTFPARQYSVNGERRAFALLRPILDATAQDRVRDQILEAYASYEEEVAKAS